MSTIFDDLADNQVTALTRIIAIATMEAAGYPDDPTIPISHLANYFHVNTGTLKLWWERRAALAEGKALGSATLDSVKSTLTLSMYALLPGILAEMANPDKLRSASLSQLAIAAGIIIDKTSMLQPQAAPELTIIHRLEREDALPVDLWDASDAETPALPPASEEEGD